MIKQYKLRDYNFRLVLFLVVLTFMGVLLVGSAEPDLQKKQFFGMMLGFIVMVIISLMDFSWILNFYWIMYVGNILMLLLVRLFGTESKGAARWLSIGSFQFQPTELSKIIIILFLARYLMEHEEDLNTFKTILKTVVLIAIPLLLIYNQPDLKNTITIAILFCILLYLAGLSYKIIGGALLIAIPLVVVFLFIVIQPDQKLIKDYQRDRIMTFLYPEEEEYSDDVLQQQNSIMAIGSGKLTGKGLNNNEVATANKGNFVSESQTDFIFSVAGEELGFLGCTALLLLMFLIIFECMRRQEGQGSIRQPYMLRYGFHNSSTELYQHLRGNGTWPQHRYAASLCQLWAFFHGKPLYRYGTGVKCQSSEKQNLQGGRKIVNIGLIAHNSKKKLMQNFCIAYRSVLSKNDLYATGTTGRLIEEASNLTVHKFLAGHLGGEQQMGALIEQNQMDLIIYLREPLAPQKHDPDVKRIFHLCDTHNIPLATNLATAEMMIKSLDRGELDWREMYK